LATGGIGYLPVILFAASIAVAVKLDVLGMIKRGWHSRQQTRAGEKAGRELLKSLRLDTVAGRLKALQTPLTPLLPVFGRATNAPADIWSTIERGMTNPDFERGFKSATADSGLLDNDSGAITADRMFATLLGDRTVAAAAPAAPLINIVVVNESTDLEQLKTTAELSASMEDDTESPVHQVLLPANTDIQVTLNEMEGAHVLDVTFNEEGKIPYATLMQAYGKMLNAKGLTNAKPDVRVFNMTAEGLITELPSNTTMDWETSLVNAIRAALGDIQKYSLKIYQEILTQAHIATNA
jgi:hypothetical protein